MESEIGNMSDKLDAMRNSVTEDGGKMNLYLLTP